MKISKLALTGALLLEHKAYSDERGYFAETYRQQQLDDAAGYSVRFIQDNEAVSQLGVLRGLHYQKPPFAQSKLVRVLQGAILDVIVDIRHGSPTFGQALATPLSADTLQQLFIPRGFAHGYLTLTSHALLQYKVDNYYSPADDCGLHYADPTLAISWPIQPSQLRLSAKDQQQPLLSALPVHFNITDKLYD
ncbi:MAG: dTDP-4-dehydrorhamnose 3,5-epimerase [Rheinheimera sp.]|uniref:dTDP-4-dehydrorhamnose 3,5-epimerase n=1 Tax=Arsukibacterium sp. UBA3155 TaxID=1946058 RepID=UPI000C98E771|nr:dTDP-4-dehydrorhamnose 3,5-epimerase [Arsukibacterium sp. UBA3155]MAD74898.1 dTDP-4-dehydrorhamnose 3,5-epimerase [Rheinheimera sp.]|tara:strand:- start:140361 stop:140936 length:576 start_codon:yes stop_codon:yes gene_type:complete